MNPYALTTISPRSQDLRQAWNDYRQKNPQACPRKAAKALNVSEVELVATGCQTNVTRLAPKWFHLLQSLGLLGPVKALTRNDHVVHEKIGLYQIIRFSGKRCRVLGENIDLHLSLSHWHTGFAVEEVSRAGVPRYSFQIFDCDGTSVHNVYLVKSSHLKAYRSLVSAFKGPDQSPDQFVQSAPRRMERLDEEIDAGRLREHWRKLKIPLDLPFFLDEFGINYFQVLRLLGNEFASRVSPDLFSGIMQTLAKIQLPIRISVRSKGVTQIHTGPIQNLRNAGSWFNVLDDKFNLHINQKAIESLWVVNWPTAVGTIMSLEFYDKQEHNIASIFGESNPREGENPVWLDLMASLPILEETA